MLHTLRNNPYSQIGRSIHSKHSGRIVFLPVILVRKNSDMVFCRMNNKLLAFLSVVLMATPFAHARPGGSEMREAVREAQQHQKIGRDSERYGRVRVPDSADHSHASDSSKKSGRMSPEERKALRQQINEAGQDLYYRRR